MRQDRLACDLQGRVKRAKGIAKDACVLHWKRATTEISRGYSDVLAEPGPSMPAGGAISGFSSRA